MTFSSATREILFIHHREEGAPMTSHKLIPALTTESAPPAGPQAARPVCLSHRSALEAFFGLPIAERAPKPTHAAALPTAPPTKADVDRACEQLNRLQVPALSKPIHVLQTSRRHSARSSRIVSHSTTQHLPSSSLVRLDKSLYTTNAPLTFAQMANELTYAQLIELGYHLCGAYRYATQERPTTFNATPLTCVGELRSYLSANQQLSGSAKAMRALSYVADGSASPRETKAAILLSLPPFHGGYGLGVPQMNKEVKASEGARRISGRRSLRCDMYWEGAKVDLEYQSKRFHQGEASRLSDSRRANALVAMGYTVIGMTNDELDSLTATDIIADSIRKALGLRSRTTVKNLRERRVRLRQQLRLPIEPFPA